MGVERVFRVTNVNTLIANLERQFFLRYISEEKRALVVQEKQGSTCFKPRDL